MQVCILQWRRSIKKESHALHGQKLASLEECGSRINLPIDTKLRKLMPKVFSSKQLCITKCSTANRFANIIPSLAFKTSFDLIVN